MFQLLLQLPLRPLLADDSRVRFGLPRFQSFQFRFRAGKGLFSLVHTVADCEETVCLRLNFFKGFRTVDRICLRRQEFREVGADHILKSCFFCRFFLLPFSVQVQEDHHRDQRKRAGCGEDGVHRDSERGVHFLQVP